MTTCLTVFVSSRMLEFKSEREALSEWLPLQGYDLVTIKPWIFEKDAPAQPNPIQYVYLSELDQADLYIGLFGSGYGEWTVDEFRRAVSKGITRLIFIKAMPPDTSRDPELEKFLKEISDVPTGLTPDYFNDNDELQEKVKKAVEKWLPDHLTWRSGSGRVTMLSSIRDVKNAPPRLIGRKRQMNRVNRLLDADATVLLQGSGGIGKTAIAKTICVQRLKEGKDPILWIRAGTENVISVFEQVVETAAGSSAKEQFSKINTAKERETFVYDLLKGSGENPLVSLVVLDNVWKEDVLNAIQATIPPRVGLLVTSRRKFGLPNLIDVSYLSPNDSLALLNLNRKPHFRDADAKTLCQRLGYLPFALEIARRTLDVDAISPTVLLERMDTEPPYELELPEGALLEGEEYGGVRDLLAASVVQLDETTRQVLFAFGQLFTAGASRGLLSLLMGCNLSTVDAALRTLQRRGLAEQVGGRGKLTYYRIHDLTYSYVKTRYIKKGGDFQATLTASLNFAQKYGEQVEQLEQEITNLLKACAEADTETHHRPDVLVGIMEVLVQEYMDEKGQTRLIEALDMAIKKAHDDADTSHLQLLLRKRFNANRALGHDVAALADLEELLTLVPETANPILRVKFLRAATEVTADLHQDPTRFLDEANAILSRQPNPELQISLLLAHGYFITTKANLANDGKSRRQVWTQAKEIFAKAREVVESASDTPDDTRYLVLLRLGGATLESGAASEALAIHLPLLAMNTLDPYQKAEVHLSLAEDYAGLPSPTEAAEYFKLALGEFKDHGNEGDVKRVKDTMLKLGYPIPTLNETV